MQIKMYILVPVSNFPISFAVVPISPVSNNVAVFAFSVHPLSFDSWTHLSDQTAVKVVVAVLVLVLVIVAIVVVVATAAVVIAAVVVVVVVVVVLLHLLPLGDGGGGGGGSTSYCRNGGCSGSSSSSSSNKKNSNNSSSRKIVSKIAMTVEWRVVAGTVARVCRKVNARHRCVSCFPPVCDRRTWCSNVWTWRTRVWTAGRRHSWFPHCWPPTLSSVPWTFAATTCRRKKSGGSLSSWAKRNAMWRWNCDRVQGCWCGCLPDRPSGSTLDLCPSERLKWGSSLYVLEWCGTNWIAEQSPTGIRCTGKSSCSNTFMMTNCSGIFYLDCDLCQNLN